MIQDEILDKDQHISLLVETNKALAERLAFLNKRGMAKNNEQSIKWRNKAFYWQRKYLDLVERLTTLGFQWILEPENKEKENGKVRDIGNEKTRK